MKMRGRLAVTDPPRQHWRVWSSLLALGGTACLGFGLLGQPTLAQTKPQRKSIWKSAAEKPSNKTAATVPDQTNATAKEDAGSPAAESTGTVKLNYLSATWDAVFRDVANASGSRLVGNRIPSGRYTRRDTKLYTRSEAVRIINKEIEPKGFRLVEQDELLIVMDIPSLRPRYQPLEMNGTAARKPASVETPEETPSRPKRDPAVRPVNHETEDGMPGQKASEQLVAELETSKSLFRSRHRPVMDISREIYRAYPQKGELLTTARDGLPGFRVRQPTGDKRKTVQFDVMIDATNEEVQIQAPKSQTDAAMKLFRALDVPRSDRDQRHLYAQTPAVCRIAEQLIPELEALRAKQQEQAQPEKTKARKPAPKSKSDRLAQLDDEEETARDVSEEPDDEQKIRQVLPPNLTDIVGHLKGEVTIQSFEDLGALILIGAADDVEQVMQVIKQLEKLSELTAPQVHLLYLEHVDSNALSELLTTVYERLTKFPGRATQPRENVAILPVSKPNSVLIIAPAGDLDAILDLAEELDQPVDPRTEFQVFPLKTAIASQVETLLTEFYEDRGGLDTRILIRADTRSNSVIVRARPRDLDEVAALIRRIDRDSTAAVSQVQIINLNHAAAGELAAILNQAIQSVLAPPSTTGSNALGGLGGQGGGGGGGAGAQIDEQFRQVKSTVLQFLAVDADGERQLRSGLLSDIRITPDPRVNALVVAAPERSMKLILELIKQLDRPSAAVAEIKVFPLTNADAQKVVQQLQGLFATPSQQGGGFNNQQRQALGIQVVGAEDAGSGLIPLRFSTDTRTNSVIAIGGAEALGVVEAILYRLDEGDIRERQQAVYRLKNSPAVAIANAVTQFLTSQRDLSMQDPNLISSVEQLEREVIVVAEPVSNSLLISATPRYFNEVQRLVKKLDEAPAQVTIQALLVEVTLDNTDEFGIEFGFQDSVLFDRSLINNIQTISETNTAPNGVQTTTQRIISTEGSPGFNFGNPATPLGNNITANVANPSRVGSQGLSNFSLGRVNGDLGFGGLVLSAGSESVNVLLRALSASRRLQVLSRPQIRTLDNQTATILQGQVVPIVNGVNVTGTGSANPIVVQQEAGIILTVTPRISPDGQIVMDLVAEKSAYQTDGVPIFTDANNGNVIFSPIKDISTARAVVSVPSNQTVVIGGLITKSDDRTTRKVPILGDIPILGYAFRYDSVVTSRKELLIFLTPRLIREDADSELIKEVEMARMHFIEAEAEEIHGPLHAIPAEMPIMEEIPPWVGPGAITRPAPPATPQTIEPPNPDPTVPNGGEKVPSPPEPAAEDEPPLQVPDTRRKPLKPESKVQQATHEEPAVRSQNPSDKPVKPKKSWAVRGPSRS